MLLADLPARKLDLDSGFPVAEAMLEGRHFEFKVVGRAGDVDDLRNGRKLPVLRLSSQEHTDFNAAFKAALLRAARSDSGPALPKGGQGCLQCIAQSGKVNGSLHIPTFIYVYTYIFFCISDCQSKVYVRLSEDKERLTTLERMIEELKLEDIAETAILEPRKIVLAP